MTDALPASAAKVQAALDQLGLAARVRLMPDSTRTSKEAADAVGCQTAQIAKSMVFRGKSSDDPVLVVVSGANRVDTAKLGRLAGEPIGRADADFVRARTGFAIGGVPPVGHLEPIRIFIDRDLLAFETIWAAAGTPHAVFSLTPQDLIKITGGQVAEVRE